MTVRSCCCFRPLDKEAVGSQQVFQPCAYAQPRNETNSLAGCSVLRLIGTAIHAVWKCKDTGCSVNQQHEGSLSVTLRKQVTIDESSSKGFFKCSTRGVRSSRATSQSKWDRKCDPGSCRAESYIVVTD
jgi:hypothetical protein